LSDVITQKAFSAFRSRSFRNQNKSRFPLWSKA